MDQFMTSNMSRFHAPGAAVVVVREGHSVFEKGYGYADLQRRSQFSPETQFRAKSVSKTITATAVMQLVETGKVDLQAPVTSYLPGFTLPGGNDPPVTLNQLLTHTSGLGDRGIGTMTSDRKAASDLRGYLQAGMPPRIASPGAAFSYTDHGISLAGLAVEEVSGIPFAEYVQERVLRPLGMDHSGFDPQLGDVADLAVGYQFVGGSYRPAPKGYFYVAPAVSLVTTGDDMGRYLIAMLGGGPDSQPILRPETLRLMQGRHFVVQPGGLGVAYGLYQWPEIGERVLLHGGLGHGFSNLLVLLPERRVGFFVNTNSDEPDFRFALLRGFMEHFYPAQVAAPKPIADSNLGRFSGVYADYRYEGRLETLGELLGQGGITVNGDRTISVSWAQGRWVEVEPLVFENLDDPNQRIAFQADAAGRIIRAFGPLDDGHVKVPWFGTGLAYGIGLLLFALLFLSAVFAWLVSGLRRLRRGDDAAPRWWRRAIALSGLVALCNLAFLIGVPLLLLPYAGLNGTQLDFGAPATVQVLFAFPLATAVLAILLAIAAVWAWQRKAWVPAARIHFTGMAVAALLFPVFLSYWKLFGLVG